MKWRVERAGARSGYIAGWLAITPTGLSSWHPTHAAALEHAARWAAIESVGAA